jgi:glycosyltransferase involved in cell wall biosynthesis
MSIEEPVSQGLRRGLPGATVLQIVPALDSAADGQETLDAALKLVRAGARALVAGREGPLVPELLSFGGEWVALDEATPPIWQLRRRRSFLGSLIESERIDILHARGRGPAKLAAAVVGGGAAIVVGCGAEALGPARDRRYGRALARADRLIVHSAFLAKRILATRQVAQERIVEIPRAVETAQFDPAAVSIDRVLDLRQAWKLGPGVRVALVPGAIQPENGQHILLEAVRMLVSGGLKGLAFVLAGSRDSAYAAAVQISAKAQGIGRTVRQVGVCRDMAAAYAAADFVVLPFIAAPSFSRTAAEALAMGRPLIASAVGCLPEFVLDPPSSSESTRTGWLVAAEDPVALARALAIAEGITAADLRAIGVQAWRYARQLFSPARVASATLAVYASLLKSRS